MEELQLQSIQRAQRIGSWTIFMESYTVSPSTGSWLWLRSCLSPGLPGATCVRTMSL
ncbi:hypothetical protein [Dictyobacter vulcani]|uniref:hypothetical protein n=1 Tax=Dictyobacter vulcani TaxID=2607529 RepID=UPI001E536E5D|nr:hypothetical protein [Dictyobacter vulcani]